MVMSSTALTRVVAADLRDRGFTLVDEGWARLARNGPTAFAGVDAPLAVVPLADSRPLTVVSAVATAAHEGAVPVLVTDQETATGVESLLTVPFLLAGRQAGNRAFVPIEDRIRLSDDSYACVGVRGPIEWFESGDSDDPSLVLEVGGETVAVLDSVDGLACPGPSVSAFRYSYARGEDGRFRVFEDGTPVEQYTSISAMRADGVRPVPLPLVPEHHVREGGRLARATLLATVAAGQSEYRSVA
jgi:hypothetical protein